MRKINKLWFYTGGVVTSIALIVAAFYLNHRAGRFVPPPIHPYKEIGRTLPDRGNAYYDVVEMEKIIAAENAKDAAVGKRIDDHLANKQWDEAFVLDILERYKGVFSYYDSAGTYGVYEGAWGFQDPALENVDEVVHQTSTFPTDAYLAASKLVGLKAKYFYKSGKHMEAINEAIKILTLAQKIRNSEGEMLHFFATVEARKIAFDTIVSFPADNEYQQELRNLVGGQFSGLHVGRLPFVAARIAYERAVWNMDQSRIGSDTTEPLRSILAAFPRASRFPFWYETDSTKILLFDRTNEVLARLESTFNKTCDQPFLTAPDQSFMPETILERLVTYRTENFIGKLYVLAHESLWHEFYTAYCEDAAALKMVMGVL